MKVLVTGGAGYIGSVTVSRLVRLGAKVLVLDNLCQGHYQAVDKDAAFVLGDVGDKELVDNVLGNFHPDVIMHFASNTLVGESMSHPFY